MMAACEQCWERANQDVLLRGGSVVDRYQQRLREHEVELIAEDTRRRLAADGE